MTSTIIWTQTDEAPALATYSLLPIVRAFVKGTGITVETRDISLAGRIIASFPEKLTDAQRIPDYLAQLGELTRSPDANIIKLPNISASIPQLKEAIRELQAHGYDVPDYPEDPKDDAENAVQARYAKVLGSAVNPVLREGNSDRRSPASVKAFSRKHPHKLGAWSADSRSRVAHMSGGDFFGSESSVTVAKPTEVRIEFAANDGAVTVLRKKLGLLAGEIIDTAVMNVKALRKFYEREIAAAKESGLLLSLHLKATMMRVSDPVMFGHAVSVFFAPRLREARGDVQAARRQSEQRPRRPLREDQGAARREEGGDRGRHQGGLRGPPAAGDGRLGSGHHQPPRPERRHRRRFDAGRHPRIGKDVGTGRQASRDVGDDPRPGLRHELRRGLRGLPGARRPRPVHHGRRAERRAHGPEGRGVRLARQDVHRRSGGHHPRRRRDNRRGASRTEGRARRHLSRLPDQGHSRPRLDQARGETGASDRRAGGVLARQAACPRRPGHREGRGVPAGTRTPRGWRSASCRRSRR